MRQGRAGFSVESCVGSRLLIELRRRVQINDIVLGRLPQLDVYGRLLLKIDRQFEVTLIAANT